MSPTQLRQNTVLLFAYNFPPRNTTGAVRPTRFRKYLPGFGYHVEVITAPHDEPGEADVHHVPGKHVPFNLKLGIRLQDYWQSIVSPYNEQLPWSVAAAAAGEALVKRGAVAAISTAPPVGTHVAAMRLKRACGIKWIADFRDPVLGNPFRTDARARIYYKRIEREIVRTANAVIVNTPAFAATLAERYPDCASKATVIPNGFDPEEALAAAPIPPRPYRTIVHAGTLYHGRHPGALLASLERLIGRGTVDPKTIRVKLVGKLEKLNVPVDAPPFTTLKELGCLEYDGAWLPRDEARRLIAESDYQLLLDINEEKSSLQVPAKLFEYIQIGRPILALTEDGSASTHILEGCGLAHVSIAPDAPPQRMDEAVLRFLNFPTEPRTPSAWFRENYNMATQTGVLAGILDRLLGVAPRAAADRHLPAGV